MDTFNVLHNFIVGITDNMQSERVKQLCALFVIFYSICVTVTIYLNHCFLTMKFRS